MQMMGIHHLSLRYKYRKQNIYSLSSICIKILLTAAWMARKGLMRLRWLDLRNMILLYIPCKDMAALITNSDLIVQLDNVFYNMEVRNPETKTFITSATFR